MQSSLFINGVIFICLISTISCHSANNQNIPMHETNPVIYFEIPVHDLNRAEKFYTAVFNFKFE